MAAAQAAVLPTMLIRSMANSVPGAYAARDASRVRCGVICGPGKPGYVVMPSVMTWLRSTRRHRTVTAPG
jgi:hypothetical protein